jgi:hypothetical protein
MSTAIMRRPLLSRAALKDRLGVEAVTYMMSARQQVHAASTSTCVARSTKRSNCWSFVLRRQLTGSRQQT